MLRHMYICIWYVFVTCTESWPPVETSKKSLHFGEIPGDWWNGIWKSTSGSWILGPKHQCLRLDSFTQREIIPQGVDEPIETCFERVGQPPSHFNWTPTNIFEHKLGDTCCFVQRMSWLFHFQSLPYTHGAKFGRLGLPIGVEIWVCFTNPMLWSDC